MIGSLQAGHVLYHATECKALAQHDNSFWALSVTDKIVRVLRWCIVPMWLVSIIRLIKIILTGSRRLNVTIDTVITD